MTFLYAGFHIREIDTGEEITHAAVHKDHTGFPDERWFLASSEEQACRYVDRWWKEEDDPVGEIAGLSVRDEALGREAAE